MKKVIVTGADGFIGRHLCKELVANGVEVVAVLRNVDIDARELARLDGLRIVYCDKSEYGELPQRVVSRDCDTLYHLAWEGVSDRFQGEHNVQLENVKSTVALFDVLSQLGVSSFIGAGSLWEKECIIDITNNTSSTNSNNMYKIAKVTAHFMSKVRAGIQGVNFVWPIITNTFGVGEMSQRLIVTLIKKLANGERPALTSGEQLYDFIYITDLARAFYLIGEKGKNGQEYVLGSGKPDKLKNFICKLRDIVAPEVELGFGEHQFAGINVPQEVFDNRNLRDDTGFVPLVSFEDGVRLTRDWLMAQLKPDGAGTRPARSPLSAS
jgi:nucleoside-diphosphate-sugar epimerase